MFIHRDNRGFTLLEILIVVVIIAALAALAIPAYTSTTEKAKKQEAFSSLSAIREAEQRYRQGATAYTNSFSDIDFDPTQTMAGQTPLFQYSFSQAATATNWTAVASRTGNTGTGGNYTVKIDQNGTFTSNF